MDQEAWAAPKISVTTSELDSRIQWMIALRHDYDTCKEAATKAHERLQDSQNKILELLKQAGKTKYYAENLGTVNVVNKFSVKTPKELSAKEAFFDWIAHKYGKETLQGMLSIHSSTLNSFINEVKSADAATEIPGLDPPVHEEVIRFTSKK